MASIIGTEGDDVLVGTFQRDTIAGLVAESSRRREAAVGRPRSCALLLLLGALTLPPTPAMATDIPFFATNTESFEVDLNCEGPWLRSSPNAKIDGFASKVNFYSATIDIFSPFGLWHCGADIGAEVSFCLFADPDGVAPVELTINSSTSLGVNYPPPPCNFSAAAAFLGDPATPGRRDRDVFKFDGVAGDTITARLDRDGAHGSVGKWQN
ncbi:MAG TPA: hypothetical protein VFY87_22300 [Geminicoccaceae bacterium]|nr:hypothetical protein [Geminicoccaceae bacterium]